MNEAILNLLIRLFDPTESTVANALPAEDNDLFASLMDVEPYEILSALEWLTAFRKSEDTVKHFKNATSNSFRIYLAAEQSKIPQEARMYLQVLCTNGIMDMRIRENIIHRIMSIDTPVVTLKQVKWMTLLAFCHQHQFETLTQHMTDLMHQLALFEHQ